MKKIILASTSPRRIALMQMLPIPFEVQTSNYVEDMTLPLSPASLVKYLSHGKAKAVAEQEKQAIVIGADSIVLLKDKILGKPANATEAHDMLKALSGTTHSIWSGLTMIDTTTKKVLSNATESKVTFREITESEITNYINTNEPMDKAGAYAIQGLGSFFITKFEGDINSAIGMSTKITIEMLQQLGITIL